MQYYSASVEGASYCCIVHQVQRYATMVMIVFWLHFFGHVLYYRNPSHVIYYRGSDHILLETEDIMLCFRQFHADLLSSQLLLC